MQFNDDYFLQVSYAKILGSRLERFRVKKESPFLAAARCPVCGDSAKVKTKTRFQLYEKNHSINCLCFNCGLSTTLTSFLKTHYKQLFDEFIFEKFRHNAPAAKKEFVPEIVKYEQCDEPDELKLQLVSDLPDDHFAKQYIKERKLPAYPFYYTDKFYEYSSQFNDTFESNTRDEARIIIPFFDRKGKIFAYQGRDLSDHSNQKYITVKINEKTPLLFGFERLDLNKPMTLLEGPLDSLFIENAMASVNASLATTANWFLKGTKINSDLLTVVLDNEPRNRAVVKEYEKAIESGLKIVIWPKVVEQYKDINNMIIHGIDPVTLIKSNTYKGLMANLKLNEWKKV
jgi:transcription elongation factor Elf1